MASSFGVRPSPLVVAAMTENLLKPFGPCPCGCGKEGHYRQKVMKDGLRHVNRCECRRCLAPRYKQRASRRERQIGAATGGRRNVGSGAFGGLDTIGGVCVVEETAHVALLAGLKRWWGSKQVQAKTVKVRGQKPSEPPAVFVASWDGKPQLVVMEYRAFEQLCLYAQAGRNS